MNPFTDEYWEESVKFLNAKPYKKNGVVIMHRKVSGRMDDYLNKNFRVSTPKFPTLFVDKRLWMSITAMEVQSMWVPIEMAFGKVATGGLGLGYFPLRVANKPEVTEVVVYEHDIRVIEAFQEMHNDRPEMKKIKIFHGDMRAHLTGETYDFVWMDIYATQQCDEVVADSRYIRENNNIKVYRYWGEEQLMLSAKHYDIPVKFGTVEKQFLRYWLQTEESNMYFNYLSKEFVTAGLKALGRYPKRR